jgi:hypothetical protein
LRSASNPEIHAAFPAIHPAAPDRVADPQWRSGRPYAKPSSWMHFSYTGA